MKRYNAITFSLIAVLFAACGQGFSGPAPEVQGIEPALLCSGQGTTTVAISGDGFSPAAVDSLTGHPALALPTISLVPAMKLDGEKAAPDATTVTIPAAQTTWVSQHSMTFAVFPGLGIDPGVYDVLLANPNGNAVVKKEALVAVPRPVLHVVEPDLVCVKQGANTLVLSGSGFIKVGARLPEVTFGDNVSYGATRLEGCADVAGPAPGTERCRTLIVELPRYALSPGTYGVSVVNPQPAGCASIEQVSIAVVPPPEAQLLETELLCLDQADGTLAITGTGFLEVDGRLPVIDINGTTVTADSVSGCTPVEGSTLAARSCSSLSATVLQGLPTSGTYQVHVTNPEPAACTSVAPLSLAVVDAPEIASVTPDLICNAQGSDSLTIAGSGFLDVDGELPTVYIDGRPFDVVAASGCYDVGNTTVPTTSCTTLVTDIPRGSLAAGALELFVENPGQATCTSPALAFFVAGPPVISSATFSPQCSSDPESMQISGTDFLVIDGARPEITVAGTQLAISEMSGCAEYPGPSTAVRACRDITVRLPPGVVSPGPNQVMVTNPSPPDCQASHDAIVGLPPSVDSVSPPRICETGGQAIIHGSNFTEGAVVSIDGTELDTTFVSDVTLTAEVPEDLAGGFYDITVTNPDGCSDTLLDALQVVDLPLVYFVDPPFVYNGINTQVTIFASGITGEVSAVSIKPTWQAGPLTALDFTFDQLQPDRIQAIIPAGTMPGYYDVIVEDDAGCVAELTEGVIVNDATYLALDDIEPAFAWTEEQSAVVIYAVDPVVPPEVQFTPTPRAYLNPTNAGPGTVATSLRSVAFIDATRLNAVVPAGAPVGTYDLVVTNPSGTVGFLPAAFEVTDEAPPVIFSINPGSVTNQADRSVEIAGDHFRNPQVTAACLSPAAVMSYADGVVNNFDAVSVAVTFDMSSMDPGTLCVVRVTNADGAYFDYSALSITEPAQNLSDFVAAVPMLTARRAPATVAGRPTRTARFLYAIGGDDAAGSVYESSEAVAVDPYGELGAWFELAASLPAGRTLAGAETIGRFIYLVGGSDGTSARDTVLRAEILRPGAAPRITDADISLGAGSGLAGGIWYYRVAVVFGPGDGDNPGGESLPSDPLVIRVPERPEKIHVTLNWSQVSGAAAYRIYRSLDAGMASGSERLITEVASSPTTYIDEGASVSDEVPLPLGSLGEWAEMPALVTARAGAGVAVAVDPLDDQVVYLYAIGGLDDGAAALASYEYLPITIAADGSHTPGTWTAGAEPLGNARWQLAAFGADHAHADIVPDGETWLYAGSGVDESMGNVSDVDAALVQAGGELGTWTAVDSMTPSRAGYGYTLANATLYAFGGRNATASDGGVSAEISGPPGLTNWNNLGLTMTEPRYLPGSVTESAFIFLIGGFDGSAASAAVEKTVW